MKIINAGIPPSVECVKKTLQRKAATEVFMCIHKLNPRHFNNYLTEMTHTRNTRGYDSTLQLPKIKTSVWEKK